MVSFHFIEHSHYFLILHCLHLFVSFFLTSLKNCSSFRPHRRWIFPGNHTPSATNVKWSVKGFKEKVHFYPLTLHQITTNLMNKEVEEVFKSLWPHNSSPLLPPTMEKSFTITSVRWEGLWGNCHKSYLVCPLEAIMSEDSLEIIKGWSCLFFFLFRALGIAILGKERMPEFLKRQVVLSGGATTWEVLKGSRQRPGNAKEAQRERLWKTDHSSQHNLQPSSTFPSPCLEKGSELYFQWNLEFWLLHWTGHFNY